ncbi:MAG: glycosyltransferase family 9 protein [Sphingomonadales bacterium]|nr:glycosyltransferase family 9 protein [Sphingomonadales bacterium]
MFRGERGLFLASWFFGGLLHLFFPRPPKTPRRILLIRLDEIGDMVTTLPVFSRLNSVYPHAEITLWCRPAVAPMMWPSSHIQCIVIDRRELKGRYDVLVDLRGTYESLYYALSHPAYRVDRGSHRFINRLMHREQPHEVHINQVIIAPLLRRAGQSLEPFQAPRLEVMTNNHENATLFLQRHAIERFMVIHTGARWVYRRWAISKWAELAVVMYQRYGCEIVFAGGSDDVADIRKIMRILPFEAYTCAGQASLLDYAALVSKAVCMIGNESGPMHIAAAMDVPVIALFGPGIPSVFAPYGPKSHFIHHKLPCNPCAQKFCVLPDNPCMNRIRVQDVLQLVQTIDGVVNG